MNVLLLLPRAGGGAALFPPLFVAGAPFLLLLFCAPRLAVYCCLLLPRAVNCYCCYTRDTSFNGTFASAQKRYSEVHQRH